MPELRTEVIGSAEWLQIFRTPTARPGELRLGLVPSMQGTAFHGGRRHPGRQPSHQLHRTDDYLYCFQKQANRCVTGREPDLSLPVHK